MKTDKFGYIRLLFPFFCSLSLSGCQQNYEEGFTDLGPPFYRLHVIVQFLLITMVLVSAILQFNAYII